MYCLATGGLIPNLLANWVMLEKCIIEPESVQGPNVISVDAVFDDLEELSYMYDAQRRLNQQR